MGCTSGCGEAKTTDRCYVEMMLRWSSGRFESAIESPSPERVNSCSVFDPIRNPSSTRAHPEVTFTRAKLLMSLWTRPLQHETRPSSSCRSLNSNLASTLSGLLRNQSLSTGGQLSRLRTEIQFRIRVVASDDGERTSESRMPESGLGSILRRRSQSPIPRQTGSSRPLRIMRIPDEPVLNRRHGRSIKPARQLQEPTHDKFEALTAIHPEHTRCENPACSPNSNRSRVFTEHYFTLSYLLGAWRAT